MNDTAASSRARRAGKRLAAVCLVVIATVVVAALPAAAHIVVTVPGGTTEGLGNLTFQVHNESSTATAVKVTVDLPLATPFGEVNPFAVQNWTITTTTANLPHPVKSGDFNLTKAVSSVTWSAKPGYGIPPGEISLLTLNAGPYPAKGTMGFPTTVTLSDGSVVHWNQATPANGQEPEFPIPTLELANVVPAGVPSSPSPTPAVASNSSSTTATIGLIVGGLALVLGVVALAVSLNVRKGRPSA